MGEIRFKNREEAALAALTYRKIAFRLLKQLGKKKPAPFSLRKMRDELAGEVKTIHTEKVSYETEVEMMEFMIGVVDEFFGSIAVNGETMEPYIKKNKK